MRVLIADDSAAVRAVLQNMLEEQGYTVVVAKDGLEAWEALHREDLRLAILDWMMPGLDGVEICRRLQEQDKARLVHVILLTSKAGDENIVAALQAGASDYLVKPFQPAELFARLRVGERISKLQIQLAQQEKLEAMGRLAAGIAHEINTPTQFVGDNVRFLRDAFADQRRLLEAYATLERTVREAGRLDGLLDRIQALASEVDAAYLAKEIPLAISQTLEGVDRVVKIVHAMKEFSHPGTDDRKVPTELNRAITNTLAVSRSEWKDVAEMVTDLDPQLPLVHCLPGPFNQVLLNLIVNAAQAIAELKEAGGPGRGTIIVSTRRDGDWTEIQISDTGAGIPEAVQPRIFEPFFTTKQVGRGTGQGLALAHLVVQQHAGTITFETEVGRGTTFTMRLPNGPPPG